MQLDSGISALLGALIGGGITLFGTWLQSKNQIRRDLIKIATDLAMKEFDIVAKTHTTMNPIETFVSHQLYFLSMVKDGKVSIDNLKKVRKYNEELSNYYKSDEANVNY